MVIKMMKTMIVKMMKGRTYHKKFYVVIDLVLIVTFSGGKCNGGPSYVKLRLVI